jgi:hypothetical protein
MYYIYHIPTAPKIGTSINPKLRVKRQGYTDFEILEEHTCIYEASRRELELQKEYGYPVDISPYYNTIRIRTTDAGKANRKITFEQAEEIRAKYKPYKYSAQKLADEYGLTYEFVKRIIKKQRYASR